MATVDEPGPLASALCMLIAVVIIGVTVLAVLALRP